MEIHTIYHTQTQHRICHPHHLHRLWCFWFFNDVVSVPFLYIFMALSSGDSENYAGSVFFQISLLIWVLLFSSPLYPSPFLAIYQSPPAVRVQVVHPVGRLDFPDPGRLRLLSQCSSPAWARDRGDEDQDLSLEEWDTEREGNISYFLLT